MHAWFITFMIVWGLAILLVTLFIIADRKSKNNTIHK